MNAKSPVRQNLLIILSICCAWLPAIGKAWSGWTEDECMRYAVAHHSRVQNKRLDIKMAESDVLTAYGSFLPSISTTGALGRRFGRSIDPQTNQYTSESFLESSIDLNITLPLFEGFARIHKLRFHKLNKQISVLRSKVEENSLAFEVLEAFYRYCFDKEMHELAMEQRKLSEVYYEQVMEYVSLGMRSRADWQEVKARLQLDIYQETVKSNHCRLSLLALKELMNMKDADTLSVARVDEKIEVTGFPLSLDELYVASESVLPEFRVMAMQERALRETLSASKGTFYPSFGLEWKLNTGYYDTERDELGGIVPFWKQWDRNMNRYVGICVSLPLFTGLSRWGAVKKERLRLQQMQHENEQQRLLLYKGVQEAYLSFRAALEECQLAQEQLRAASMTWEESEEKWKEGMISVFELLEKRNRYIRAKAEIIRTKLQYNLKKRLMQFYQEGTLIG